MAGQRGAVIVELALAAALAGLLALWASRAMVNRLQDAQAQAVAAWMRVAQRAAQDYVIRHAPVLREGGAAGQLQDQGYADWRAPTLAELKAAGLLPAGFPLQVRPVGSAGVFVLRDGHCPERPCRISPVVYSAQPFLDARGQVDAAMVAEWMVAAQGLGAAVQPAAPGWVQGPAARYPNPLPDGPVLPAGTVVLGLAGDHFDFLRVGDWRDPQFQSDASVAGDVLAGASLRAQEHLFVAGEASWWTLCEEDGAVARDQRGGLLYCHYGFWMPAVRSSGGYSLNSNHGCFTPEGRSSANPATGSCSCPPGAATVPFSEGGDAASSRGITRGYLCVD